MQRATKTSLKIINRERFTANAVVGCRVPLRENSQGRNLLLEASSVTIIKKKLVERSKIAEPSVERRTTKIFDRLSRSCPEANDSDDYSAG